MLLLAPLAHVTVMVAVRSVPPVWGAQVKLVLEFLVRPVPLQETLDTPTEEFAAVMVVPHPLVMAVVEAFPMDRVTVPPAYAVVEGEALRLPAEAVPPLLVPADCETDLVVLLPP